MRVRRGGISSWEERTEGTSSSDPNSEEAGPGLLASAGGRLTPSSELRELHRSCYPRKGSARKRHKDTARVSVS